LTPAGDKLIYFAAKYETPTRTWTAISRPPFLTALALWPKGDAWGGGGLFDSDRQVRLNHRSDEMELDPGFRLAPSMKVDSFGPASGRGEDEPIHDARLRRDGWQADSYPVREQDHGLAAETWITFEPPIRYTRTLTEQDGTTLEMSVQGIHQRDGAWYLISYRLMEDAVVLRDLGRADWADRAPDGDLLLARDGRLYRLSARTASDWANGQFRDISDLRDHRFQERKAPQWATSW
jgi:hypothetical protein